VVDLASDEIVLELVGHSGDLRSAFFSEDGRYVVTSSEHYDPDVGIDDRSVRVWDALTGGELAARAFAPLDERPVIARFSPDAAHVVAGTWKGKIALWDWRRDELRWLLGNPLAANDARFSPDGRFVLSGSEDRSLRLWFADTRELAAHYTGHRSTVLAHAISPDGRTIASQSTDGTLRVWPLDPLAEAREALARLGPPTSYERERIADALAGR
jgi:WD40 repeat protein